MVRVRTQRRQVVPQCAQGAAWLDDRVQATVQASGNVAAYGGVEGYDLCGVDIGDRSCGCVGEGGELLHDLAFPVVGGQRQRPGGSEPDVRDDAADFLPPLTRALRSIELVTGAPAADPDETEIAHRRTLRCSLGFDMRHGETGPAEFEGVPRSEHSSAGDHRTRHRGSITSELSDIGACEAELGTILLGVAC